MPAIRVHPQNPKLFEFRAKPNVLVTATEHYGAVMNRPFRYAEYLRDAAEKGINFTRLFMLFREQQTPINPYSTCKPESPDYIAPFMRTGAGRALDGELKYDLDHPNPEFFARLHDFIETASRYEIVVEVVLLSNVYSPTIWGLNPLHPKNNVNGLPDIRWDETMTMRHPALFERQAAHVRAIVTALQPYDNVIYEICNEPMGNQEAENTVIPDEIDQWLNALIAVVRETEAESPDRHLIAGQQSYSWQPFEQRLDKTFREMDYDIVNIHALPGTIYGGMTYQLGDFMSKQLRLRAMRDFGLATYAESKPLNQDEDNVASCYKDDDGWTIHRKRAWVTLLTGGHYDYIDFSIHPYLETGTPASKQKIRTWIGTLARYIHALDLVRAHPLTNVVKAVPEHVLDVTFGVEGEDYTIYLADERELADAHFTMLSTESEWAGADMGAGSAIQGVLTLNLPDGAYEIACFDPKTNQYSPAIRITASETTQVVVPPFIHDIVVRIHRLS